VSQGDKIADASELDCPGSPYWLQSWSKGRCEVNIMSRSNTSYWNNLMRVQNGMLENNSV